jgi:hypothetical protein
MQGATQKTALVEASIHSIYLRVHQPAPMTAMFAIFLSVMASLTFLALSIENVAMLFEEESSSNEMSVVVVDKRATQSAIASSPSSRACTSFVPRNQEGTITILVIVRGKRMSSSLSIYSREGESL